MLLTSGTDRHLLPDMLHVVLKTKRARQEEAEAQRIAEEILNITGLYDYRYNYATSLPYGLKGNHLSFFHGKADALHRLDGSIAHMQVFYFRGLSRGTAGISSDDGDRESPHGSLCLQR